MRNLKTNHFAKRHYETIAEAMQQTCPEAHWDKNMRAQFDVTVTALCAMFKSDNPQFQSERFRAACEPGNNVRARS